MKWNATRLPQIFCNVFFLLCVTSPGCWIGPGLQFRHMLWKTRKKNTCRSSCPAPNSHDRDSTNIIQSHPSPLRRPDNQSIRGNTHPGKCLISRAPFLYLWNYKLRVIKSQVSQRQREGNRLLMQTWFQCQPWRCPFLGNVWFIAFLMMCREGKTCKTY